jgi:hypothetical protein
MTNSRVVQRELGDTGREWVRGSLAVGFELSAAVSALDLAAGKTYGFYPPGARDDEIRRFESTLFSPRGPLPAELAADSEDAVIELARATGADVLLLESAIPQARFAEDAGKAGRQEDSRALLLPHVVFWRPLREGLTDDVGWFMASQGGYDNVFVVEGSDPQSLFSLETPTVVSPRFAQAIRAVLVPAYDSDTYVLWEAPASSRRRSSEGTKRATSGWTGRVTHSAAPTSEALTCCSPGELRSLRSRTDLVDDRCDYPVTLRDDVNKTAATRVMEIPTFLLRMHATFRPRHS